MRSLVDEIDRVAPPNVERAVGAQMVEELTRLGCRCVELAGELARVVDEAERARGMQKQPSPVAFPFRAKAH